MEIGTIYKGSKMKTKKNKENKNKIKIKQIIESKGALDKLLNNDKIPIKTAFILSRFAQNIQGDLVLFEEKRNELIKKFGIEKENNIYEVLPENLKNYYTELNPLLDLEITIEIPKININDLNNANLSAIDLLLLDYLIDNVG